MPTVYRDGVKVPSQREHEASNFNVDWRVRSVFSARLAPGSMARFDIKIDLIPTPAPISQPDDKYFVFDNGEMALTINFETGLVDSYRVGRREYFSEGALCPLAMQDDENSWAFKERAFRNIKGSFKIIGAKESASFCGI